MLQVPPWRFVYLSGEISYPKSVTDFFFSAYLGGGQKKDVPSAVGSRVNNIKANGGQSNTIALMLFTPKALFVCSSFCLPTQSELSVSSLLLK